MSGIVRSSDLMKIAHDLGMSGRWGDPVDFLRQRCIATVERWVREFQPSTLEELLDTALAHLGVLVEEIHRSSDLESLCDRYARQGELGFERVRREFDESTFALVVRLRSAHNGCTHVAVIDCRGPKAARRWFSKWHEIAHLLTQPQLEFSFRRCASHRKDPLEQCMDLIAGDLAFYEPLCPLEDQNSETFTLRTLENHRIAHMAQASRESAYASTMKRVKFPLLFLIAEPAFTAEQRKLLETAPLFPDHEPKPALRATRVMHSDFAAGARLFIPRNMRVPERSVIHEVHRESHLDLVYESRVAHENLDWWESSSRGRLPARPVIIEAAKNGSRIFALLKPA